MAITPSGITLNTDVTFADWPTETWGFDKNTGRLSKRIESIEAMRQAIEIILNIPRYYWQIYTPNFGNQIQLTGEDYGYTCSEVRRRVDEAFSTDNRITGTDQWSFSSKGPNVFASFIVKTVFGDVEVTL